MITQENTKQAAAAHTAGPWLASENGASVRVFAESDEKSVRCVCDVHQYHSGKLGAWSNARLIAAAPEMLAALRDLLAERYACQEPEEFDAAGNWTSNSPASVAARAAIAKATGGAL